MSLIPGTPYYSRGGISIFNADCRLLVQWLPPESFDVVITDPPYGCGKAEWDGEFPIEWYSAARRASKAVYLITGSSGLVDTVRLVGDEFVDVISGRNLNGMTRGPLGFGNWLATVVAGKKPRQGWNAFDFVVRGDMPDHPSPKPLEFMEMLIDRVTNEGDSILDPFGGSMTTGVAAWNLGRRATLIEISEAYCEAGAKRLDRVISQGRLFRPEPPLETQHELFE